MAESRIRNVKRNLMTGLLYRAISILLPFIIRTAILYILGEQYLGLSSLFSSILQVLNLAELGFSSAIVYNMYRPVAEGDAQTVCALLNYYKKACRIIGGVIALGGLLLTPWLPWLVHGAWLVETDLYLLYLLYLLNTAVSYFLFAYQGAVLNAVQRADLANLVQTAVQTAKYLVQLLVLLVFKSYYLYMAAAIAATIVTNLTTAHIAVKRFPQFRCRGEISAAFRKDVREQVGGLMIGKLSDTSRNCFDSIVLSAFFGLTAVAVYNNYFYIYGALYSVMLVITGAMQASVGNSIATESREKNYRDLQKVQFLFAWLVGWCTACMLCLYQPFMALWAGEGLLLSEGNMVLFCVYFYAINMNSMRNLYFEGSGLWGAGKLSFVLEGLSNLALNLVLGALWGTAGVLLATILTIFGFNFIARTNILFKSYFKRSPRRFYWDHFLYAAATAFGSAATYFVCEALPMSGLSGLFVRGIICIFLPNALLLLCYFRKREFAAARELVKDLAKMDFRKGG